MYTDVVYGVCQLKLALLEKEYIYKAFLFIFFVMSMPETFIQTF